MKKFLNIILWTGLLAGVVFAMAFAEKQHRQTVCSGFDLVIENPSADMLMTAREIRAEVLHITDTLEGRPITEVNLKQISAILKRNPYIASADVMVQISGQVLAEVSLRRPLMRIEGLQGKSYYLDEKGWLFPVNPGHPVRVVIASGYMKDRIPALADNKIHVSALPAGSIIAGLYEMAVIIDQSAFLQKLISQVWIQKNGEADLMPTIGDYEIRFGGLSAIKEKFDKLETFFREGAGKAGWVDYRSVDLRYENQIICSKK